MYALHIYYIASNKLLMYKVNVYGELMRKTLNVIKKFNITSYNLHF